MSKVHHFRKNTQNTINSMQQELGKKVLNSFYDIKEIDGVSLKDIKNIYEEIGEQRFFDAEQNNIMNSSFETLKELYLNVSSSFAMPYDYKINITLLDPHIKVKDKKKYDILPSPSDNTMYRIVFVSGSHEIFTIPTFKSLFNDSGIFVPCGSAIKVTKEIGNFEYRNNDTYDAKIFPGRGIKRPENRYIIIFDFISDKAEDKMKVQKEEIEKASKNLTEMGGGFFNNILKSFKRNTN